MQLLLVLLAMPLLSDANVVRGRVTLAGVGVAGVEVTLHGATRFTDERGRYTFDGVPAGLRVVKAELKDAGIAETVIEVKEGENRIDDVVLPWADPSLDFPCTELAPESVWDRPTCTDYDLDTALIESVQRGDSSAIALLQTRYANATTYAQRFRIAEVLLGRAVDDDAIWAEVQRHADVAVRILGDSRERFEAYCDEHDLPPAYEDVVWAALGAALGDSRARPLLRRALESQDRMVVFVAIFGFARQKDESALPAIEKAIARFPDSGDLKSALEEFRSPAANALLLRAGAQDPPEER